MSENTVHLGRNIKRIRELLGVKQDALAIDLGDDWNQQKISYLEGKQEIDAPLLEQVARALKVTPEAIKNFNEQATVNYIANTFNGNSGNYMNFNPVDKIVELYERLISEKDALIREKDALIDKLLNDKNAKK